MNLISDIELSNKCAAGSQQHWTILVNTHHDTMFKICQIYFKDVEQAKDALQRGFIRIFENISKYSAVGSFEGWMRRIMKNNALNMIYDYKKRTINHIKIDHEICNDIKYDDNIIEKLSYDNIIKLIQKYL